jgi:hypothetical protein
MNRTEPGVGLFCYEASKIIAASKRNGSSGLLRSRLCDNHSLNRNASVSDRRDVKESTYAPPRHLSQSAKR